MSSEQTDTTQKDKEVTVAVPEDRVAEFHAFFARFLAAPEWRRRRRGRRGHGRCHHHGHGEAESAPGRAEPTSTGTV
jgi:hypothetical protein